MTDKQLQLALANLLPEVIRKGEEAFFWVPPQPFGYTLVKDTEWLHVCWLVEKTIKADQIEDYRDALSAATQNPSRPIECCVEHWSWQERAEALCKVRGIEA